MQDNWDLGLCSLIPRPEFPKVGCRPLTNFTLKTGDSIHKLSWMQTMQRSRSLKTEGNAIHFDGETSVVFNAYVTFSASLLFDAQ